MISRKDFLKGAAGAIAAAVLAPVAGSNGGCAPTGYVLHLPVRDNRIVVPREGLPDLSEPGSFARLFVNLFPNPVILFRQEDAGFFAVLSTCSHNGCEVRKLYRKFECPCHGSEYDLYGRVTKGPAPDPLETFHMEVFVDRLEIILEGPP